MKSILLKTGLASAVCLSAVSIYCYGKYSESQSLSAARYLAEHQDPPNLSMSGEKDLPHLRMIAPKSADSTDWRFRTPRSSAEGGGAM